MGRTGKSIDTVPVLKTGKLLLIFDDGIIILGTLCKRKLYQNHQANEHRKTSTSLTPGDWKARKSLSAALLQSITKIGSQGAMKNHGKALNELTTHIITQ
jgi:hypothetical protein